MKRKNIYYTLIILGVLIFFVIPKVWKLFAYDTGMQQFDRNYPEINYQLEASALLEQKRIGHKIDSEGILRFNHRHKEKVKEIYKSISQKYKPDWPNIYWADQGLREQLIAHLQNSNIPYLIRKLDEKGGDYVLWPPEFDDQVKSYNKKLLDNLKKSIEKDI